MNWRVIILALGAPVFGAHAADTAAPQVQSGKQVFDHWCAPCHAPGPGHPGTAALAYKYRGQNIPPELEARTDIPPELVKILVRHGISVMPMFRKTEISDDELDNVANYLAHKPEKNSGTLGKSRSH